ncbi:MAG: HNH endonuclease [Methylacidiphilales bacterium]|nr:HNH endonuclease [Candidatus Methylacidiphilales bacterium]
MEAVLSQNVLVLNRLWQAVNICSVKRAFMLLYQGHAQVVESGDGTFQTMTFGQWFNFSRGYEGEDVVSTVSFKIRVPKVILLLFFDRMPKKEVKFTRHNIFERDHNTCQYCGHKYDRKDLNLDHVIPRDRGGETSWENIVCSCVPCNSQKGNRTPAEAGMKLLHKPKRPKWRPMLHLQFSKARDDSWKHFVDLAYWNVELTD